MTNFPMGKELIHTGPHRKNPEGRQPCIQDLRPGNAQISLLSLSD